MGILRPYHLPRRPLRIVDLCGGLATGLEALLKAGYAVTSYAWLDIDTDAHATVSHRLPREKQQYPHLLPPEAIRDWDSRPTMAVRAISSEILTKTFPKGVDLMLASPSPMLVKHLPRTHSNHGPHSPLIVHRIVQLISYMVESQPEGVGYL